jgi:hypothetical protein
MYFLGLLPFPFHLSLGPCNPLLSYPKGEFPLTLISFMVCLTPSSSTNFIPFHFLSHLIPNTTNLWKFLKPKNFLDPLLKFYLQQNCTTVTTSPYHMSNLHWCPCYILLVLLPCRQLLFSPVSLKNKTHKM